MDKCLFCSTDLPKGSEEHVFLSALGGRVITHRATCQICNNAFASVETGKIDDALADAFIDIRNGLKIWTGRKQPPPTITRAGTMPNGAEFDLAPGFVPVIRPGRLPNELTIGSEHLLVVRDEADAKRLFDIMGKRGITSEIGQAVRVQEKAPTVRRRAFFDGLKVWRGIGKTAAISFVVLYGNEQARHFVSKELRDAIRYGEPSIKNYVGWDFTNEWPVKSLEPHQKTPGAQTSGFEHSVVIADVGEYSVAYVTLFGDWRFSVLLGAKTNLPARGLAVNPRASKPARFIVTCQVPVTFLPKHPNSMDDECELVKAEVSGAFQRARDQWDVEAHDCYNEQLADELNACIEAAGEDEQQRAEAIGSFAEKLATLECGAAWETDLANVFDEDGSTSVATNA